MHKSSVNLKRISTLRSFKSLWSHYINLLLLYSTERKCSTIVCLLHCRNLSQHLKKSAFIRKSNLKFCKVTSTKDSYQIPKHQISVAESLTRNVELIKTIKGALPCLRQLLATKNPLKLMKNAFYFTLKALFGLKILYLCLDFLLI